MSYDIEKEGLERFDGFLACLQAIGVKAKVEETEGEVEGYGGVAERKLRRALWRHPKTRKTMVVEEFLASNTYYGDGATFSFDIAVYPKGQRPDLEGKLREIDGEEGAENGGSFSMS